MESGHGNVAAEMTKERSRGLPRLFGRFLFPHFCVSCGDEGVPLCQACANRRATPSGIFTCPSCGFVTAFGGRCQARRCASSSLDGLISAAPYADPVLRGLLRLYKYEGVEEAREVIDREFSGFLSRGRTALAEVFRGFSVESVPLHFLRRAARGFNQSDFLATRTAEVLGLPRSRPVLRRGIAWSSQARMSDGGARRENARNAFAADRRFAAGDWVVVDDVATSVATLEDCARALKAAGAGRVWGVTLLRG
jgi:competence protein ComFC